MTGCGAASPAAWRRAAAATAGLAVSGMVVAMLMNPQAATAAAGEESPGEGPPLTNEEIVRLVITGTPEASILRTIDRRPAAFDLDPEVITEMRRAGVGAAVIDAMRRRQAAMPRAPIAPLPETPAATRGTLEIVFETDPDNDTPASRSAIALRSLPPTMRRPGGLEVAEYRDMALAILCTTTDHVPDHWDTRSPVAGPPRHELILFTPGSGTARDRGFEILYLDRQDRYSVEVPAGQHDIQIAAAGQQSGSGTWRVVAIDGARLTVLPGLTTRVRVKAHSRVSGSAFKGYAVDSAWKVVGVEMPADARAIEGLRP